eukprot:364654-Chlamydomonas_euryale.AAC.2
MCTCMYARAPAWQVWLPRAHGGVRCGMCGRVLRRQHPRARRRPALLRILQQQRRAGVEGSRTAASAYPLAPDMLLVWPLLRPLPCSWFGHCFGFCPAPGLAAGSAPALLVVWLLLRPLPRYWVGPLQIASTP